MTDIHVLIDLRHIEEVAESQPLLRGLLRDLPVAHSVWSKKQRRAWLELAASILAVLYTEESADSPEV
jgi:hypothetical protein